MKSTSIYLTLLLIIVLTYVCQSYSIPNRSSIKLNNIVSANSANSGSSSDDDGFIPAEPVPLKEYKVMFYLDTDDEATTNLTLLNIKNSYGDPRLQGRLQVMLVVFSKGYQVYMNSNPQYQPMLQTIQDLGCVFVLCGNTIKAFDINLKDAFKGVHPVPSANGELILRLNDGWVSIHP